MSNRCVCDLLTVNRSTLYDKEKPPAAAIDDVELLNMIRDVWTRYPFYGYRRITQELRANGLKVNRKRVQRLMGMGGYKRYFLDPIRAGEISYMRYIHTGCEGWQ